MRLSVCVSKLLLLLLLPTGQLSRKERGERLTGDEDLLSLFTTTIWPPSATGLLETLPPTSKLGAAAHCALVYVLLLPRIFFPVFFKLDYSIYFPPFLSFSSHRVRERGPFLHRENEGVLSVVGPNDETRSRDRLMAVAQDTAHKPPPHKLRTLHLLSLSRFEKRPFCYLQRKERRYTARS